MAPVEPPGDERGRHAHGHAGEANGVPWGGLDELLWGSDDLWRDWGMPGKAQGEVARRVSRAKWNVNYLKRHQGKGIAILVGLGKASISRGSPFRREG